MRAIDVGRASEFGSGVLWSVGTEALRLCRSGAGGKGIRGDAKRAVVIEVPVSTSVTAHAEFSAGVSAIELGGAGAEVVPTLPGPPGARAGKSALGTG